MFRKHDCDAFSLLLCLSHTRSFVLFLDIWKKSTKQLNNLTEKPETRVVFIRFLCKGAKKRCSCICRCFHWMTFCIWAVILSPVSQLHPHPNEHFHFHHLIFIIIPCPYRSSHWHPAPFSCSFFFLVSVFLAVLGSCINAERGSQWAMSGKRSMQAS